MTVRLVGLISIVLLLCLASFGLLIGYYQDQLMQEVARTASAVGQATLRTLELRSDAASRPHIVLREPEDEEARVFIKRFRTSATAEQPSKSEDPSGVAFTIDIEDVTAEADPAHGLMLKIPRLTPSGEPESLPRDVIATREVIRLPIPTGDYQALFRALRSRSLFLFVGVFAVGMVLSAGLATRFTRPIRRLDAGIRSLSEGDLDVSVAVQGKDEIARLSRAFNEMARKLRSNRDRSRELVRREKLSALGRLAAGVAHDVRNPLHSIGLTLQNLSETSRPEGDPELAVEFDRSIEIIRAEIRRLDQLVDNFLRFARSDRRERHPVQLRELLEETVRLVSKEAERREIEIELQTDETVPSVVVDAEALRSAILNLVLNSFEAMPGGGTLSLKLESRDNEVLLEVADTGRGIPSEEHDRVFEFAYTTREGGSGLGLAMVHHCIVEEHGGRVALESQPDEGTRVILALPASPPLQEALS